MFFPFIFTELLSWWRKLIQCRTYKGIFFKKKSSNFLTQERLIFYSLSFGFFPHVQILLALQTVLTCRQPYMAWGCLSLLLLEMRLRLRSSRWSVVELVFRIRSEKGLPSPASWKQSSLSIISLQQSVFIRCLIKI